MLEQLENRRLLSVTALFQPKTGVLTVAGDENSQEIEVNIFNSPFHRVGTQVIVVANGKELYNVYQTRGDLQRVEIFGAAGDDVIHVFNEAAGVGVVAYGERGADQIDSTAAYPAPGSEIDGGLGDDTLILRSFSKINPAGHFAQGGPGNDLIYGSSGSDVLWGDMADGKLAGNDSIYGGMGNDMIYGGDGDDMLFGDEGNDVIDAGAGSDFVDGGAGEDVGIVDGFDKYDGLEKLVLLE